MKLTTKLLLGVGLTFILGTQAFAYVPTFAQAPTTVNIYNQDCKTTFDIYGYGWKGSYNIPVPLGKPDPIQISLGQRFLGWEWGAARIEPHSNLFANSLIPIALGPGKSYSLSFKMKSGLFGSRSCMQY